MHSKGLASIATFLGLLYAGPVESLSFKEVSDLVYCFIRLAFVNEITCDTQI